MTKQKIRLIIPLSVIAGLLIYCWTKILVTNLVGTWQHYLALGFFGMLVFLFIKNFRAVIIATGFYLLLTVFGIFSLTPESNTSWLRIGPIETPHINLLSFGLFIFFFVLNLDQLIDIYLDYKEKKTKHKT